MKAGNRNGAPAPVLANLARRAGIRPETLNRIEQGRNKPSVPTITKIDPALTRR